ncbi:MAG: hypothetical protein KF836_08180 [Fimbriimonadaceae bacterium]|nr:hypothetical protein [Fimbriimonadaceae bacterium]
MSQPLPAEVQAFAQANDFPLTQELDPGYCSRIFRHGDRILKFPFQGEEQTSGFHAAYQLEQIGGPKIYAGHEQTGSLIMEFIPGGMSLTTSGQPDEPTFIHLARQVQKLSTENCLPLENYYQNLPDFGKALFATTTNPVFLHGDLHHSNILLDERTNEFRPIDPKGLVGDAAFECVAFLRNPIDTLPFREDLFEFTVGRIERLSQALTLDPARIAAWTYIDRAFDPDLEPSSPWRKVIPTFERIYHHFL